MNKSKVSKIENLYFNKWTYILLTVIFFSCTIFLFSWKRDLFFFEYSIKNDLFGQFGDFSGGVLGTIFALISTLLLLRTLYQQQQITNENKRLTETQRFNDLFFEILNLYQEQTKELQDEGIYEKEVEGVLTQYEHSCNNKDFFDFNMYKVQKSFTPQSSYSKNQREAQNVYSTFFLENKSKLAIYYRTLYRIFDLIHNSKLLDEESKRNYSKIVRAQLTESELFFLRYNSMTYYGKNFIQYLNRYNILKHLPHFELLEFKDWWEHLNSAEKTSIDVLFCIIKDMIKDAETKNIYITQQVPIPSLKYSIYITFIDQSNLAIEFRVKSKNTNTTNDYKGFEKFKNEEIQALLDCFLKELVLFSNFKSFNNPADLKFLSPTIVTKSNTTTITSCVKNTKNNKLRFRYDS